MVDLVAVGDFFVVVKNPGDAVRTDSNALDFHVWITDTEVSSPDVAAVLVDARFLVQLHALIRPHEAGIGEAHARSLASEVVNCG